MVARNLSSVIFVSGFPFLTLHPKSLSIGAALQGSLTVATKAEHIMQSNWAATEGPHPLLKAHALAYMTMVRPSQ